MDIKVGISACLLGQKVRYDGSHKKAPFIKHTLSQYFDFVPLCPEVAIGLGTPRAPIHLIQTDQGAIEVANGKDHSIRHTQALKDYAHSQVEHLKNTSGYIFMQKSPSCGYERVKVNAEDASKRMPLHHKGQGIFAAELDKLMPHLPKEDAGRLNDEKLKENFLLRVHAYHDWQVNVLGNLSKKSLIEYHSRYKYMLMARSIKHYRSLGRLVSNLSQQNLSEVAQQYMDGFTEASKILATPKTHSNVLQHLMGYLKKVISADEKQALLVLIDEFRKGLAPLVAILVLLNHHVEKHLGSKHYLAKQIYLKHDLFRFMAY